MICATGILSKNCKVPGRNARKALNRISARAVKMSKESATMWDLKRGEVAGERDLW
jgi:hypothetical protein